MRLRERLPQPRQAVAPWWRYPAFILLISPGAWLLFYVLYFFPGALWFDELVVYPLLAPFGILGLFPLTSAILVAWAGLVGGPRLWNPRTHRLLLLPALVPWIFVYRSGRSAIAYFDPPPEVPLDASGYALAAPLLALPLLAAAWLVAPRLPWLAALYPLVLDLLHRALFFPLRGRWESAAAPDEFGMPAIVMEFDTFLAESRAASIAVSLAVLLYAASAYRREAPDPPRSRRLFPGGESDETPVRS